MAPLRIGTRGSRLALWQARFVADLLRPLAAPRPITLVEIETGGDRARDRALSEISGEGIFTKEIQRALGEGSVDVAVHSLKDLPTIAIEGLVLAAVPQRGPSADAFVSRRYGSLHDVPPGGCIATSSLRRQAQLLHYRPDLKLAAIRGNVETRLQKLAEQNIDALILAEAGLVRLALAHQITELLSDTWMLPAVGQGALGLECRTDDGQSRALVEKLDHRATRQAVTAERSLLRSLGGGCQVPLGAVALCEGTSLRLRAAVLDPAGKTRVADEITGEAANGEQLGRELADRLAAKGAKQLLDERTRVG